MEEAPLPPHGARRACGHGSSPVDAEEGFGLFAVPSFEGTVALVGVMDGPAALDAVAQGVRVRGRPVQRRQDGSVAHRVDDEEPLLLFLDRGYLYLAMPEKEEPEEGEPVKASASSPDPEELRRQVMAFTGPGLSEAPLLTQLRGKVQEGNVYLFTRTPEEGGAGGLPRVLLLARGEGGPGGGGRLRALEEAGARGQARPRARAVGEGAAGARRRGDAVRSSGGGGGTAHRGSGHAPARPGD